VANQRRAFGRFEAALGLIGVLALATTYILISGWNPLPKVQAGWDNFVAHAGDLSNPKTEWTQRVGGQPNAAVVAGDAAVVTMRGAIEARGLHDGKVLWTRDADWAAVAGDGATSVAIVGRRGEGLEAIDPDTGTTRWKDGGAVGAWTFQDAVLTLTCPGLSDCTLANRKPSDGTQRWKMTLPGIGRVLAGANSTLLGSRELSPTYHEVVSVAPRPLPPALGFPTDQRVQVVDTLAGRQLRAATPTGTSRVVVLGGRIITSTAIPKDGTCRYTLEADDASTGKMVWKREGYDLHTADGAGCEQRKDPPGTDGFIAATRGDNKEAFLATQSGKEVWVGVPGEVAAGADGHFGLVRSADKTTIKLVDLARGATLWTKSVPAKAGVAVTSSVVLVDDETVGQVTGYAPGNGEKILDAKTDSTVLGYNATGVMLGRGRTIGFLPFSSAP
jgi:hypothetical protein